MANDISTSHDAGSALTDEELAALDAQAAAATAGPWESFVEGRDHTSGSNVIRTNHGEGPDIELSGATTADQDFISSARDAVPRLVAEIRRLRRNSTK